MLVWISNAQGDHLPDHMRFPNFSIGPAIHWHTILFNTIVTRCADICRCIIADIRIAVFPHIMTRYRYLNTTNFFKITDSRNCWFKCRKLFIFPPTFLQLFFQFPWVLWHFLAFPGEWSPWMQHILQSQSTSHSQCLSLINLCTQNITSNTTFFQSPIRQLSFTISVHTLAPNATTMLTFSSSIQDVFHQDEVCTYYCSLR